MIRTHLLNHNRLSKDTEILGVIAGDIIGAAYESKNGQAVDLNRSGFVRVIVLMTRKQITYEPKWRKIQPLKPSTACLGLADMKASLGIRFHLVVMPTHKPL